MKHFFSRTAVIALGILALLSCRKETAGGSGCPVFTASIAPSTRVNLSIEGSKGSISFSAGDEIFIVGSSGDTVTYSTAEGGAKALFKAKEGQNSPGKGPYSAFFGALRPNATQTFKSGAAPPLILKAQSTDTNLEFRASCALLQFRLGGPVSIRSIMASTDDGSLYTLDCPDSVDCRGGAELFIAVPESTVKKVYFTNGDGRSCIRAVNVNVPANTILPISFYDLENAHFDCIFMGTFAEESGLPLFWAWRNLNAGGIEQTGDYFDWGGTRGWHRNSAGTHWIIGKETHSFENMPSNTTRLSSANDAASIILGSGWRMPTASEFDALSLCHSEWVDKYGQSDVSGRLFSSAEGHTLFLPATGYGNKKALEGTDAGYYWCSDPWNGDSGKRSALNVTKTKAEVYGATASLGFTIRPVKE